MKRGLTQQIGIQKEMEGIEDSIVALGMEMDKLQIKRYELLAKKEDLEMKEVIEYAIEAGVTSQELMGFVVRAAEERRSKNRLSTQ